MVLEQMYKLRGKTLDHYLIPHRMITDLNIKAKTVKLQKI